MDSNKRPRLLTKSRYKLGLECPNKLFYTRKKQYANQKQNDSFLQALANGGFQVEELARLHYPEGVLIDGRDWDYEWLVQQTEKLLRFDNIVIFEAAFRYENLFIRTDILVKKGNTIQLIEVKAKSFHPESPEFHRSTWKPYLFDVAFQKHVILKSHPDWSVTSFFMLADKSKRTTINGLNQKFRITKKSENRTGIILKIDGLTDIESQSVLSLVDIEPFLEPIFSGQNRLLSSYTFEESIQELAKSYEEDTYFNYPLSWSACKKCEFKATGEEEKEGLLSGFKNCWNLQRNWGSNEFKKPNMMDVWDFKRANLFDERGIIFKEDVTEEDIGYKEVAGAYSRTERQWIQIQKDINADDEIEVLREELQEEMNQWIFPLNFIDFETSTSALPFYEDRKPYEQIAFQFSHHILHEDGSIEHASEYINAEPGVFPNFNFIRALKRELEKNKGSIFKYSNHENTILNAIYEQLAESSEIDRVELMSFIQTISHSKKNSVFPAWEGERDMIDLCAVIIKYYYNPHTKGSNSIKKVLPAVFKSSPFVREKYSKPIKEIGLSSRNFKPNKVWLQEVEGLVKDPYYTLPKPFEEWDAEAEVVSELEELNDGGAALMAYGKIQYTDMSENERELIKQALLKYCELDTLAMVMIYEHLREII